MEEVSVSLTNNDVLGVVYDNHSGRFYTSTMCSRQEALAIWWLATYLAGVNTYPISERIHAEVRK